MPSLILPCIVVWAEKPLWAWGWLEDYRIQNQRINNMNDADFIPIAALNQYAYCAHRCWRMFCAGLLCRQHW